MTDKLVSAGPKVVLLRYLMCLYVRISIKVRKDGLLSTLGQSITGLMPHYWYVYRLRPPVPAGEALIRIGSELKELSRLRLLDPDLPSEFYRDVAERSKRCYYACIDEKLAGIVWLYEPHCPNSRIRLAPGEVEIACLYVAPRFRGHRLAQSLVRQACSAVLSEGDRPVYAIISRANRVSQAVFEACKFERVGTMFRSALVGRPYVTAPGKRVSLLGR